MTAALFLRIAAVVVIVQAALHTVGGVFGKPVSAVAAKTVVVMRANHFPVMGLDRTYWDFYLGFGLSITIFLLMEGIVFALLGNMAAQSVNVRPLAAVFCAGYVAQMVLAYRFFFPPPLIGEGLVVVLLGLAAFASKPTVVRSTAITPC